MTPTGLIIDGQVRPCAQPVYNWRDTGKEIRVGKGARKPRPKQVLDTVVWHWTGGEGDLSTLHHVLQTRGYGVEFYIANGTIYQLADPVLVDAFGAGSVNPRAISVEIQNYGFRKDGDPIPVNPRGLRPMLEVVQGGRKREFAAFFDDDLAAVAALADALHNAIPTIPRTVLVGADGKPYSRTIAPARLKSAKGNLGHYHISSMKSDPGPQPLQRLLDSGVAAPLLWSA